MPKQCELLHAVFAKLAGTKQIN